MAQGHPVTVIFIIAVFQDIFQKLRLFCPVQVKLRRAVVFPPVVFMVLAHVQHHREHVVITQGHGVAEAFMLGAYIFVKLFCPLALDLVVAPDIDDGNFASCDAVGQFVGQLGISLRFHHGHQVTQQHHKVHVLTDGSSRCPGGGIHRFMDITQCHIIQSIGTVHAPEAVFFRNNLTFIATEGATVDHLLGTNGIAAGGIQHILGYFHFMDLVSGLHTAGIKIVINFIPHLHPADGIVGGGKYDLVIILHRVDHRAAGKAVAPKRISRHQADRRHQHHRGDFQPESFASLTDRREEQQQRKAQNTGCYPQGLPEMHQDKAQIVPGSHVNDDCFHDQQHGTGSKSGNGGPSAFFPGKQAPDRQPKHQPHQYQEHQRQIHYQKRRVLVGTQEFGDAGIVDPQGHPKQRHHQRQRKSRHREPILFNLLPHRSFPP